jgi:hypothetical protein
MDARMIGGGSFFLREENMKLGEKVESEVHGLKEGVLRQPTNLDRIPT